MFRIGCDDLAGRTDNEVSNQIISSRRSLSYAVAEEDTDGSCAADAAR
jgi:hypothetical protein